MAAAIAFAPAHADDIATPGEIRALRAKSASSPPNPSDYAAKPYPGATFDPECSAEATAPLPPDARYDRECSAAASLDARRTPQRWRRVWCCVVDAPIGTVAQAFDSDCRFKRKRGVQVELVAVSSTPPTGARAASQTLDAVNGLRGPFGR